MEIYIFYKMGIKRKLFTYSCILLQFGNTFECPSFKRIHSYGNVLYNLTSMNFLLRNWRILCQLFKCGRAINLGQNSLPFICLIVYVGLVDDKFLFMFYYLARSINYHLILGHLFWKFPHLKALPYSKVQSQWHNGTMALLGLESTPNNVWLEGY
jgi:hypothetical protein